MMKKTKKLLCMGLVAMTTMASVISVGAAPELCETVKDPYVDEIKVAYLPNTLASGNGTVWGEAVGNELGNYSNITYNIFDGKGSAEVQNEVISELIVQEYDALVLQPADASAISASVSRAEDAGIKVITLNINVEVPHTAHVQAANYESGEMAARVIGEELGGEGTVGLIDIAANMRAVVLMGEAFKETMANEYPNITVVADSEGDWTAETANSVTRDYLAKYPEMAAIYTCGDPAALGAYQAAQAADRDDLIIWGCDGEATVMESIENGGITGTIYMDYYDMGKTAARMALHAMSSGVNGASYDTTPLIKIPALAVDADNVASIAQDKRW